MDLSDAIRLRINNLLKEHNLTISKLVKDEVLILGEITSIRIN